MKTFLLVFSFSVVSALVGFGLRIMWNETGSVASNQFYSKTEPTALLGAIQDSNIPINEGTQSEEVIEVGHDNDNESTILKLEDEIIRLNDQIHRMTTEQLESSHRNHRDYTDNETNEPKQSNNRESNELTKEEIANFLSEPFLTTVENLGPNFSKSFKDFTEEEIDYDWAYMMENKLKDYILMHEQAVNIQLESVTCKESICEIKGFQTTHLVWNNIAFGLRSESWWSFKNSQSTSQTSKEYGDYFYVILTK